MDEPPSAPSRSNQRDDEAAPTHEMPQLEVRLFGGVDLRWRGTPLVGLAASRRTRALLQHLILARGESVARDELAFELWPDVPDARARASLRQALLRAARLLPRGHDFVLRTPTGAAWNLAAPARVDVLRFDALLRQAAAARANDDATHRVEALEAAVALYRGDIEVDVSGGRLERARAALQREAQQALREVVELHRAAGRIADAIAAGERLLELDPLDEPTYALLMELHEASDTPRKGLRVYERLTTVLRDEVSDTPGEHTTSLAARLGARVERVTTPEAPLAMELRRALDDVAARCQRDGTQLLVLRAAPGHPWATLLTTSLARLDSGAVVARAARNEVALPFAAVARLLSPARLAAAAERLDAPWSTELRRLVGAPATTSPPADTVVTTARVDALHEALSATLLTDGAPTAIVLEDAQHVDAASALWLRWLLERPGPGQLIALVLDATEGFARVPLDATLEVARDLGRITELDAAARAGPDTRLLDARRRELSAVATRVLEALAVLGFDAEPETLRRVVALPRSDVAAALDELARSGFTESRDAGRTVAFRSASLRDAVMSGIAPATRVLLHAQAADVLRSGVTGLARHDAIVAEHLERAGRAAEAAVAWAEAGRRAASVAALDAAIAAYERAIGLSGDAVDGGSGVPERLWRELGEVHARRLDGARARHAFHVAAQHAGGDVVTLAVLAQRRAESYVAERAFGEALRELDIAEAALRSQQRRSRRWWRASIDIDAVRARTLYFSPDGLAGDAGSRRALLERLEHAVHMHGTLAQRFEVEHAALRFLSREARYRLTPALRLRAELAERTAVATGDALAIADARFGLAFTTLFAGDPEGAIGLLHDARRLAERCGVRLLMVQCAAYLSVACRLTGRLESLREAQRDLAALVAAGTPLYSALAHAQAAYLAYRDGDHAAARQGVAAALNTWGERWYPFRWTALVVALALDERDEGLRRAAAALLADDQQRPAARLERSLEALVHATPGAAPAQREAVLEAARAAGWL